MRTKDKRVLPATQVIIGGGTLGNGRGQIGKKIIKVPSKRTPAALRLILDDYSTHRNSEDTFLTYLARLEDNYHYDLLKEIASVDTVTDDEMIDWGHSAPYIKAIGVGECAGVVIDLISTLFFESEEKIELATRSLESDRIQDSIYHSYQSLVNTAKAMLLSEDHATNTQIGIINLFDTEFVDKGKIKLDQSFSKTVLSMKTEQPTKAFAQAYLETAIAFYQETDQIRKKQLEL